MSLDGLCLDFFPDFSDFFLGGSVGQIIYREYIVFRGSKISCSLACGGRVRNRSSRGHQDPRLDRTAANTGLRPTLQSSAGVLI